MPPVSTLASVLRLSAASVVPGGGFLFGGWSPATALALYWIDNLVSAVVMSARIGLHRRWTGLAGHQRGQLGATYSTTADHEPQLFKSFLAEFLVTSVGFTLAHGVFLAAVLGIMGQRPDTEAVQRGAIAIATLQLLAFSFDAVRLDEWPFARLKQQAIQAMSRITLVHMALLGGMMLFALRGTPGAFFTVFVWLKFFSDIGSQLPQWNPHDPPRWLVRVMSLFPKQKGESFEEYWRRTRAAEDALAAEDERATRPRATARSRK
jgi:hypothetical protein